MSVLAVNYADIVSSGITDWRILDPRTGADRYYPFLNPRSTSVDMKTLGKEDSLKRFHAFDYDLQMKATVPVVRTTANQIKLLDTLSSNQLNQKITLSNGQTISSALATEPYFGFGWELATDSMEDDLHLNITADRYLTRAEFAQILGTAPGNGTLNGSDNLKLMDSATIDDIAPGGISKIEVGQTGTSFTDNIGMLQSAKFSAKLTTKRDTRGRTFRSGGIMISVDAEAAQASNTELLQYPNLDKYQLDWKLTFVNGIVLTLTAGLGFQMEWLADKDADGNTYTKVTGGGIILPSAWDACWSA